MRVIVPAGSKRKLILYDADFDNSTKDDCETVVPPGTYEIDERPNPLPRFDAPWFVIALSDGRIVGGAKLAFTKNGQAHRWIYED